MAISASVSVMVLVTLYFPETTLVFAAAADAGAAGDGHRHFIALQRVEQRSAHRRVKLARRLQFSKFQPAGGGLSHRGEEFFLKEAGDARAATSCSTFSI